MPRVSRRIVRPRGLHCGVNVKRFISHGCGAGATSAEAVAAAVAEARMWGGMAAAAWAAQQRCPKACPIKSGHVGKRPTPRLVVPAPKVLSESLVFKKGGDVAPGSIVLPGSGQVFRVCVAIVLYATVVCDAR